MRAPISVNGKPTGGYSAYRRRAAWLGVFFAAYVLVAVSGSLWAFRGEYFPVFSWSLFSKVDGLKTDWRLMVHRVGERQFDPPVGYYELGSEFGGAAGRDSTVQKALRFYAWSVVNDPESVDHYRRVFERLAFANRAGVEYELIWTWFNPLQRWREGTDMGQRSYGRFTTGAAQ